MAYVFYENGSLGTAAEYRFRCDNHTVNGYQMDQMEDLVRAFLERYEGILRNSNMDISLKPGKAKIRGIPEYEVTIKMVTRRGLFHTTSSGIGVNQAMKSALNAIRVQLATIKSKMNKKVITRDKDPYMASEFMEEA